MPTSQADSYEELIDDLEDAVEAQFGENAELVATFGDRVIYKVCQPEPQLPPGMPGLYQGDDDEDEEDDEDEDAQFFEVSYTIDEATDAVAFGTPAPVDPETIYSPLPAAAALADPYTLPNGNSLPPHVKAMSPRRQRQFAKLFRSAHKRATRKGMAPADAAMHAHRVAGAMVKADDSIALMYGGPGGKALPANVAKLSPKQQRQWTAVWNSAYTRAKKAGQSEKEAEASAFAQANGVVKAEDEFALADTTDKPWDGSAARFGSTEAYCKSCLIDDNEPGASKVQSKCHLPVREPDGTVNLNAVRNARGRISQLKGVSSASKAAAQKRLDALAKTNAIGDVAASDVVDGYTIACALRLDDAQLPAWQQVHRIGEWAVPHPSGVKIKLTRDMGDRIIENFQRGVVRQRIPLDERHQTDADGHALGWFTELRWGRDGEGLPGKPEPGGAGNVLYGRVDYTQLGRQKLTDRQYAYISPQYHLDYPDKETGKTYGPALLAVGSTNRPFLRLQSLQGEPPMPVAAADCVVLEDGLRPYHEEATVPDETPTTPPGPTAEQRLAALEAELASERTERERIAAVLAAQQVEANLADVDRFIDAQVYRGVPPGNLGKFRTILRTLGPTAPGAIQLADDGPTLNLADALREAISDLTPLDLGVHTRPADVRPGQDSLALEDQLIDAELKRLQAQYYRPAATNGSSGH